MARFRHALLYQQVVELGSMAAAAREQGIAPSVVSKHLAELEASLGAQLLTRTTRKIAMTEAGEYFYHSICGIGANWQALQDETARLNKRPAGKLSIAAPSLVHSRVLMTVLSGFAVHYPDVKLELRCVDYEDIPFDRADISIARKREGFDSATYIGVPIYSYSNSLFASSDYLAKHGEPQNTQDLLHHQCLSYGVGKSRRYWHFSQADSILVNGHLSSNDTEVLIRAALQHQGIVYIPRLLVSDEIERGLLKPILVNQCQSEPFELMAYYRKQAYLPQKTRVLIDYLIK
ncbi:LysR family transcriptional regulator [Shewanella sp. YLB-07]|uniref:LysR family transcriptional regulator n=1 Tax=Shewanella sp. YLB-07 TaxID=2601268 RepID=UPI00128CA8B2|nr:LysR family transcriptional regulator [Shewanella sp. YLB-07]MPY23003.1 LysR family transcriptional regulator [Shewanella sp. YLB-07]